jgi:hypothetical protein
VGVLDTPFGPAQVRGVARAEAVAAVDGYAAGQGERARRSYAYGGVS